MRPRIQTPVPPKNNKEKERKEKRKYYQESAGY
jgi:hypothetical protein